MTALVDGFVLDVAVSESHTFDSDVTSDPVESGADVTDHVRPVPITVTLSAIVSDTPVGPLADQRDPDALPSEAALAKLLEIREAREPVTIETSLQTYENMVLGSLSVPRDADTGDALSFQATFHEVRIVDVQRETVNAADPRGQEQVNLGHRAAPDTSTGGVTPPSAKTRDQVKSLQSAGVT